jgi:hypothetical protein
MLNITKFNSIIVVFLFNINMLQKNNVLIYLI